MNCTNIISYIIKPRDNLYQLSRRYNTTVADILRDNPGINPYDLKVGARILICPGPGLANENVISKNQFQLSNNMRDAWVQHVMWTRMLVMSIINELDDTDFVTNRLLQNPALIVGLLKPYFGQQAANTVQSLLTDHLVIGAGLIRAVKDNNTAEMNELNAKWYANADDIARALNSLTPAYDYNEMRNMLYDHLNLTKDEVAARLNRNYTADIQAFDNINSQALGMADSFTNGIVASFPDRF